MKCKECQELRINTKNDILIYTCKKYGYKVNFEDECDDHICKYCDCNDGYGDCSQWCGEVEADRRGCECFSHTEW